MSGHTPHPLKVQDGAQPSSGEKLTSQQGECRCSCESKGRGERLPPPLDERGRHNLGQAVGLQMAAVPAPVKATGFINGISSQGMWEQGRRFLTGLNRHLLL